MRHMGWDQGGIKRDETLTPLRFHTEENPHPASRNFEEHQEEETRLGLGQPRKTWQHPPEP